MLRKRTIAAAPARGKELLHNSSNSFLFRPPSCPSKQAKERTNWQQQQITIVV
jgi:hypothetical protein